MAQVDITITDQQYTTLVNTFNALKAKLNTLRAPLAALLSQDGGKAKVKAFVANHPTQARLLVITNQIANYLDQFRDDIHWE